MALPKLSHAQYSHHLVGLGKTIKYRPFTNAEQKALLVAKNAKGEAGENELILNAVTQIVENCTLGKVKVDQLSTFDIEDLFMRIRAKSVGEIVTVQYRYDYQEDGKKLSNFIDVNINIDDIKVEQNPDHVKKIQLDDNIGIVMKYPTFDLLKTMENSGDDQELAMLCIDYIYDNEEIYPTESVSRAELEAFYDDIDTKGLLAIQKFFQTMPKLRHTVEVEVLPGKTETVVFEGLNSFFT